MLYQNLKCGLRAKQLLVPYPLGAEYPIDNKRDWYTSLYQYTEEQVKIINDNDSVSGITDTTTDKLYFDFDSREDLEAARRDTVELVTRLKNKYKMTAGYNIFFSGCKGFGVEVFISERIKEQQLKDITRAIAHGLSTFDEVIYDSNRVVRLENTCHPESKLYKIPITENELRFSSVSEIKEMAKVPRLEYKKSWVRNVLPKLEKPSPLITLAEAAALPSIQGVDFNNKIKGFSNCKWALAQGLDLRSGDRKTKIVALCATCKSLGFTRDQTYVFVKNAANEGCKRYGCEPFSKDELWNDILGRVYSNQWNGGTYSCKDGKTPWLTDLCRSLGKNACSHKDIDVIPVTDIYDIFKDYVQHYDNNVLKTGIDSIDKKCKFMVGTSNGLLGAPSCGKTSLALQLLNYNSKIGNTCVFFSFDMFHAMVYMRMAQQHFGINQEEVFRVFREDPEMETKIREMIDTEYKNVNFCFKAGQTIDELYDSIIDTEQHTGTKVRLVVVDYNELVMTDLADPTASSAFVAQRLRQIANETSTCVVTLLQPSKLYSNPAEEIKTYQASKGSNSIPQSVSLLLSISRPGFSVRHPERDKFLTVNALKNRNGGLFSLDMGWSGVSGKVRELSKAEKEELEEIREEARTEQANSRENGGWGGVTR